MNVVAVAEHRGGKVLPTTYELVSHGRELVASSGGKLQVVVLGRDVEAIAADVASRGAPVILVEHEALAAYTAGGYAQALTSLREAVDPRVLLMAHSSQGFDLGPRVAAEWGSPIAANCLAARVEEGTLLVTKKILNDKMDVELEVRSEAPYVVTMRPGSAKPAGKADAPGPIERAEAAVDAARNGRVSLGMEAPDVQDIDIASADVVVSAGRGIQKPENLKLVEELAKSLGGVVGASRPLTDLEWLPRTRQVGQSGKTVRPKLYIACGISGAMQHVAGMKDSSLILAVNTDPSAPIFEVAHYGVVANVLEFLPALLKELRGG